MYNSCMPAVYNNNSSSVSPGFPYVKCPDFADIDYLTLYSETKNYRKTDKTAVCFYQYDRTFDGIDGIFNAIYYHNERLLSKYKERFKGIRFAIAPDYSQCGDAPRIENLYRLFKSRIDELNDGSFEVEDLETERAKAL